MESIEFKGSTFVFDLDGTLVDTAPDLVATLNHVLGGAGFKPRTLSETRPFISFGARRMIEEGLRANGALPSPQEIESLFNLFLAHYGENVAVASRPYPGVEAFLEGALAAGARLSICTNKNAELSNRLIRELGMDHYFHAVAGRDTFPFCKPHPGHLTGAVEMAGGNPLSAVMIGDSETDIATAKAARIPVVAVTFGYSEAPVSTYSPDRTIGHYDELQQAIYSLFSAT